MKRYFDIKFFKSAILIALPIVIQQLVTSFAQLIDNIMVGSINGQAIAGVGAANSILLVIMTSTFGISEGASIFIAQQYGANKRDRIANSLAISVIVIAIVAILTLSFINIYDNQLLRIFIHANDSSATLAMNYGMEYLNVLVWGYWILMLNTVLGSSFRAIGKTKVPMLAGVTAVVCNTMMNFILIPIYGVKGAAVATIISRVVEFVVLFTIMKFKQNIFEFNLKSFTTIKFMQFKVMIKKMIPLTINEFLWGLGTSTLMAVYGARSINDLASIQITYTLANILFVSMAGFGVAVAVLIGQKLGNDEFDQAIENSKKLLILAFITGVVFFSVAQLLSFVIPILYNNVDNIIQVQSANLLRIMGIIFPVYIMTVTLFFTLRAGGDTLGVLIMDGGIMWGLSIPVAFILMKFTSFSIYGVFIGVESIEFVKLVVGLYRYKKYKWVQNIT